MDFNLYPYQVGEHVKMRKKHPCGGFVWEIQRVSQEVVLRCETCGHQLRLPRRKLEKATKEIIKPEIED